MQLPHILKILKPVQAIECFRSASLRRTVIHDCDLWPEGDQERGRIRVSLTVMRDQVHADRAEEISWTDQPADAIPREVAEIEKAKGTELEPEAH